MEDKKKRLRWRKQPNEKVLARIVQSPRGFALWWGDEDVADVYPSLEFGTRMIKGWYWAVGSHAVLNMPHANTAHSLVATPEEAKEACMAYVKGYVNAFNDGKGE